MPMVYCVFDNGVQSKYRQNKVYPKQYKKDQQIVAQQRPAPGTRAWGRAS